MKWFLFLIMVSFIGCNSQQKEMQNKGFLDSTSVTTSLPKQNEKKQIDSFEAEWILQDDTGYFKNLTTVKINELGYPVSSLLDDFLDNLISKKEIHLLNKEGLSHSCKIIDSGNIRFDTLQNRKTSFIQKQRFGFFSNKDNGNAVLKIDGKNVKAISVVDSEYEPFLNFFPQSFRHFLFHGKEFYYIQALYSLGIGGSMQNVTYHLLYDVALNKLFYVNSCRLDAWVPFGDVNNDGVLDLIDFDNSDFCTLVPGSDRVTIQLYSYKNGKFVLQKDKSGTPYFIEGNTGANYTQDSFNIKKINWPVKLNN